MFSGTSISITPTDNWFFHAKPEKSLWGSSIEEVSKYDYPDKVDRSEPVRINIFFILLIDRSIRVNGCNCDRLAAGFGVPQD